MTLIGIIGLANRLLEQDEQDENHDCCRTEAQGVGRVPAIRTRTDDGVDRQHQSRRAEDSPGDVQSGTESDPDVLFDQCSSGDEGGDADRNVDEEDPVPAQRLGHVPPDQKAERSASDGDDDVRAHGLGPLGREGEIGDDDGQDDRGRQGGAQPLDEPGPDEESLTVGSAARGRGQCEQRHADQEDLLATDEVTESTRQQERAGKGDQIGVDHPGQRSLGEVQIALDGGQGHVHDRLIEDVH